MSSLRIRLDDGDDVDIARAAARDADVQLELESEEGDGFQPEFVEPVSAILVGAAIVTAAKFVMDWWSRRPGGLVIDLRPGAADDLYRDKDLPWGYVVVFMADGKVTIETKDAPKDAMERLVGDVISGGFSTVKAVSDAAKGAGAAGVKPEPSTT
jgi:hypothetical protein